MAEQPKNKKLPVPPLPTTAYTTKTSKKRKTDEEKNVRRKEAHRARNKNRVYLGVAFERWREVRDLKRFKLDSDLAIFLLESIDGRDITRRKGKQRSLVIQRQQEFHAESDVGADEVIVKLECLLQLFQKCFECCSKCSISKERNGRLFCVTQKCQKCRYSREWRSHPPEQEVRDPAANPEVAEETVTLSFGDSDTESVEEEKVKADIPCSQSEEEDDEEVVKDHHPLTQSFVAEGFLDNASEDLGHINIEKVNDSGIQTYAVSDSGLHGEREDESFLSDSSLLEEEMVEERERQGSDDDWVPSSDVSLQPSDDEDSGSESESEARGESRLHLPLAWCSDCQTDFKRSCFIKQHRRLYGCLLCGVRKGNRRNTTGANEVATQSFNQRAASNDNQEATRSNDKTTNCNNPDASSTQCGPDISNGHKLDPSTKSNQHTVDCTNQAIICSKQGNTDDGIQRSHNCDLEDLHSKSNYEVSRDNDPEDNSNYTKGASDEDHHRILNIQDLLVRFSDLDSFQTHAMQCHGIKRFRELCPDCGKFITMVNKVVGGPPHICEYKVKPNFCEICGKRFATRAGLHSHTQNIHSEKYELPCHYCLKPFKLRKNKLEHEKIHLNEDLKFYCPDCPQRFANHRSRNIHRKTHWTRGRYICKVCNKGFSDTQGLKRHEVIHSGLKPFACQLCHRSFNQQGHLKSHMRLHTGERPFKCQDCGQCFNHNVSLKNHIKHHHGPSAQGKKEKGRRRNSSKHST